MRFPVTHKGDHSAALPGAAYRAATADRFAVLIGADGVIDPLKRVIASSSAGVCSLSDLRRHLISHPDGHAMVCVSLDLVTLQRHDAALALFLADLRGFPSSTVSIGLVPEHGLCATSARLGCDIYAADLSDLLDLAEHLATPRRDWQSAVTAWRSNCHAPTDRFVHDDLMPDRFRHHLSDSPDTGHNPSGDSLRSRSRSSYPDDARDRPSGP